MEKKKGYKREYAKGWGEKEMGNCCLMGIKFSIRQDK